MWDDCNLFPFVVEPFEVCCVVVTESLCDSFSDEDRQILDLCFRCGRSGLVYRESVAFSLLAWIIVENVDELCFLP